MAFVVEDGTGVAGANAYITVAEADTIHLDRQNQKWVGGDLQKQAAIICATDYVESRWYGKFLGSRLEDDQGLSMPRGDICDEAGNEIEGIPDDFKKAIAIYALKALSEDLYTQIDANTVGKSVNSIKEKVGPIETETKYTENGSSSTIRPIPEADSIIRRFVINSKRVIRA